MGGADCGPSNPLQNLSKRFDQDRGIQQVCGASQAFYHRVRRVVDTVNRIISVLLVQDRPERYVSRLYQSFTQRPKHNITQTFRTQGSRAPDQDAARFFSSSPIPQLAAPAPFDLSGLHHTLPGAYSQPPVPQNPALASWASDFMMQQQAPGPQILSPKAEAQYERERSMDVQMASASPVPQGVLDRPI
jgi:peroxin-5